MSDGNGNFWGTTTYGGAWENGTVFKVNIASGALTTVASFDANNGSKPCAGLVSDGAGNFWGTTMEGGKWNKGTVFRLNMASGKVTTVVHFGATATVEGVTVWDANGRYPSAGLASDGAGNLWGTTPEGGPSTYSGGTVFKVNVATGELTTLVAFHSTSGGFYSLAGLVNDGGNMWGTTKHGGSRGGGTIFKVNIASGELTTVLDFDGIDHGRFPIAGLVNDGAGNLWGTTKVGGPGWDRGTVFKVNIASGELTTVVSFTAPMMGYYISAGLVADGEGNMWGTTTRTDPENLGHGTVFKVNMASGELTTVVTFDSANGSNPLAGLASDGEGNLWGTTSEGGGSNFGTVFKVHAASGALTTVADFNSSFARRPFGGLVCDGAGNMWGTTSEGGTSDRGTIFKLDTANGALATVVNFDEGNGDTPLATLIKDGEGNLWGTTSGKGLYFGNTGTVFRMNLAREEFSTVADVQGFFFHASLVGDGQGNLWGTAAAGGAMAYGKLFALNTTLEDITTEIYFGPTNGRTPYGGLISDGAGRLWGTTAEGPGASQDGTIFQVDVESGTLTTVLSFNSTNGSKPCGSLFNDGSGHLWGTTTEGGRFDKGTVFKMNVASGELKTVVHFNSANGSNPYAGLVSDGVGNLWGTTERGGKWDYGTVFKLNAASGILTTAEHFDGGNGGHPVANLAEDGTGDFWGTTYYGGPLGGGTVFRMSGIFLAVGECSVGQAFNDGLPPDITAKGPVASIKGLPAGLKYNKITAKITGRPTKPGSYTYTAAIKPPGIQMMVTESRTINVVALPAWVVGSFTSQIAAPDSSGIGGSLAVKADAKGAVSGTLYLGAKKYSIKGQIEGNASASATGGPLSAEIRIVRNKKNSPAEDLTLTLDWRAPEDHAAPGLTATLAQGS